MRKLNWYYFAMVITTAGSFLIDFYYNTTYWTLAFSSVGIGYAYNGWVHTKFSEIVAQGELTTKLQASVLSRLRFFAAASFIALISLATAFVIVVEQTSEPYMPQSFSPVVVDELAVLATVCYGLLTLGSAELFMVLGNFTRLDYRSFHRPTYGAERLPLCFGLCLLGSLLMLYGAHTVFAIRPQPGVPAPPETIFFFVGLALWGPTAAVGFVAWVYAVPAGLRRLGRRYEQNELRRAGSLFWIPFLNLISPGLLYAGTTALVSRLETTAAIPWGTTMVPTVGRVVPGGGAMNPTHRNLFALSPQETLPCSKY